jgi:hypothetical protein
VNVGCAEAWMRLSCYGHKGMSSALASVHWADGLQRNAENVGRAEECVRSTACSRVRVLGAL